MPTIYTFDGTASTGANRVYDAVRNPSGGFAAELASRLVAADRNTWAWTPIDYNPGYILTAYEPFGNAVARGVADAIAKINTTPGEIVLASHSQGSHLTTTLYNEFRYGSLRGRRSDLIGIFTFGDVHRPSGWTVPLYGSRDAGGTGAMTLPIRQSYGQSGSGLINSPEPLYWSFANLGDTAAAAPSGVQPIMSQVIRRILYSGSESPDRLIFLYGDDGKPNSPPQDSVPLTELAAWCSANQQKAQAKGLYAGQSLLDLIIALVGSSSVVSVSGIITLLTQWWPFAEIGGPWGFLRSELPQYSFRPHVRYSGSFPYTGLANNSKTAVTLAFDYLSSLGKKYLPTTPPPTNSKADRPYQLYTFGRTGEFYAADGRRTAVGADGGTEDIGRSDIDYGQAGYGAEIAKAIDPTKVEWVPVSYNSAAFPLRLPIQSAVDKAVRMILATPNTTKFFLAGHGVGAAVTSRLYDEFRNGRLQSRVRQLLGVFHFGSPYRERGIFRATADPGGHGIAGTNWRITNSDPSLVWEFVVPDDPVATTTSDIQRRWAAALYDIMHFNVATPGALKPQISESLIRPNASDPALISFVLDTLNTLFSTTGKHNEYQTYHPFTATKTAIRLAADAINSIVGVAVPSASATESETGVVTPATRQSLMNTRTYLCVPDAHVLADDDLSRVYAGIKKLNVDYIRIPIPWSAVQPSRNLFTADRWEDFDIVINKALEANLQPLVVISPPFPSWARPTSANDIVAFTTELVDRYKPNGTAITVPDRGVLEYQIWDEPNAVENWPSYPVPSLYAEWLKQLYPVIKELQPQASVLFGGLQACVTSFSSSRTPTNISAEVFLRSCYDYGAKDNFDIMAYHPLTASTRQIPKPAPPNARTLAEADRLRAAMVAYGDNLKPMYWTKVGFNTSTVTQLQQREYLNTMRWFAQTRPWLTGLAVYSYRDSSTAGIP